MRLANDVADLFDVIGVMPRHVCGKIADGNAAALGMNPMALPLLRCELLQKLQVGKPQ